MGVKGLLQKLGDGLQRRNIFVDCRGQTVGIDGNVWFYELGRRHLGDWRHARWEPIVAAFIERAAFLLASGITPVFVFDGAPVPAKKEEHERRAARRAQATEKFLKEVVGDGNESAAVHVTWDLVSACIDALRDKGFAYFVAPYEGDGQLAHLCREGVVDAVFTVDSDLIVLGCKRTYLKVNFWTGSAELADLDALPLRTLPATGPWTLRALMKRDGALPVLRTYAVLAGCDYDTKAKGVGPATALEFIEEHGTNLQAIAKACETAPPGWYALLQKGIECFVDPVVYHVGEGKQQCLSSARTSRGRGHLGTCAPDGQARERALGLITPTSDHREVVRVRRHPVKTFARDSLDPTCLEFHMVEGAVLPYGDPHGDERTAPPRAPCDVNSDEVKKNDVSALKRWLQTRGLPAPHNPDKSKLVRCVVAHLEKEKGQMAKGEMIYLRDPDGGSLHTYIARLRERTFPQLDPKFRAPTKTAEGWERDPKVISRECPVLQDCLIQAYYMAKSEAINKKVLAAAHKRMVNRSAFPSLRFHDAISPNAGDCETDERLCWVHCYVPASMKAKDYAVSVALRYIPAKKDTPKLVYDIVSIRCDCVAGAQGEYGYCVHGATVLLILNNLSREGEMMQHYVPVTSMQCKWNMPTQGEAYDVTKPVACMPITKDVASKPVKRNCAARSESAKRAKFVAHTDEDLRNNDPTIETRVAAMEKLCDIIRKDLGGKCAYEVQWLPDEVEL